MKKKKAKKPGNGHETDWALTRPKDLTEHQLLTFVLEQVVLLRAEMNACATATSGQLNPDQVKAWHKKLAVEVLREIEDFRQRVQGGGQSSN